MVKKIIVIGGGIGGMATALACSLAGNEVHLLERAGVFAEVGAGVQSGPNVTRWLQRWNLDSALQEVAAFPDQLQVGDAVSGQVLGTLRLGSDMQQRYGAPYATLHRADLHGLLLQAVQHTASELRLNQHIQHFGHTADAVSARNALGEDTTGDVLVGADGLWSAVRQWLLHDGPPRATGQWAYRALVPQTRLPAALRSQNVTVWLGPNLHVVHYPVRRGEWLNVVAIVQGQAGIAHRADAWDHSGPASHLRAYLADVCAPLQNLAQAIDDWRLWLLHNRPPMRSAAEHAVGRVTLLGDAAHPMLPYLAQGAGMAIEDAGALAQALGGNPDVPAALAQFAQQRWQRNARVQARSSRNARIFHAAGLLRWGRNRALQLGGARVMDLPWLYNGS